MNDTARDSISYQPADTQGLDDLFSAGTANECQAPVPTDAELIEGPVTGSAKPEPVPVEEAAVIMGLSLNALKKQLRKGSIKGFKQQTKHGEKWFVDSCSVQEYAPVPGTANECQASVPTDAELIEEPVASGAEPEPVPVDKHLEVIQDLQRKIEVLTYRNGYLEAQLEAERQQVKLLTDSQHKQGWWTRFSAWFMGRQS